MKESQIAEFKASWRDEYLKHLCAFANTRGGRLFIGVADDGSVVGAKKICCSVKTHSGFLVL